MHILPDAVIGRDKGAAPALGRAPGVAPVATAEVLPPIESVMVRKVNERMAAERS